jgi:hypothetical protein
MGTTMNSTQPIFYSKVEQSDLVSKDPYSPYSVIGYQAITQWRNEAKSTGVAFGKRLASEGGYLIIATAALVEAIVRATFAFVAYIFSWITGEFGDKKLFYDAYKQLLAGACVSGLLFPISLIATVTNLYGKKI